MSSHFVNFKLYARHEVGQSLQKLAKLQDHGAQFVRHVESIVDRHDCTKRWSVVSFSLSSGELNVFKTVENIVSTLRENSVHGSIDVLEGSSFRV